jgi:hypothetical protein
LMENWTRDSRCPTCIMMRRTSSKGLRAQSPLD